LNEFSNYFNRQFTPEKSKAEVVQMLLAVEVGIKTATQYFQTIKNPSSEMQRNINAIFSQMKTMSQQLAEYTALVDKYFNTAPAQRAPPFWR
jgi:predicted translin family RNA/ssDNA-binding protein